MTIAPSRLPFRGLFVPTEFNTNNNVEVVWVPCSVFLGFVAYDMKKQATFLASVR